MAEFLDSTFWVAVGFAIVMGIAWYFGAFRTIIQLIDKRRDAIRSELEEARRLHAQAAETLAQAERARAAAEAEANEILDTAQRLAETEVERLRKETEDRIARRAEAAERAIEQAEREAASLVNAHAADLAAEAARELLRDDLSEEDRRRLFEDALSKAGKHLH